ncbi:hypothetical protein FQA39_LY18806 [Lamprigera yunnana]|nr:hypothetical protein FQA39_LY18806 [Lamprigera yunnana]
MRAWMPCAASACSPARRAANPSKQPQLPVQIGPALCDALLQPVGEGAGEGGGEQGGHEMVRGQHQKMSSLFHFKPPHGQIFQASLVSASVATMRLTLGGTCLPMRRSRNSAARIRKMLVMGTVNGNEDRKSTAAWAVNELVLQADVHDGAPHDAPAACGGDDGGPSAPASAIGHPPAPARTPGFAPTRAGRFRSFDHLAAQQELGHGGGADEAEQGDQQRCLEVIDRCIVDAQHQHRQHADQGVGCALRKAHHITGIDHQQHGAAQQQADGQAFRHLELRDAAADAGPELANTNAHQGDQAHQAGADQRSHEQPAQPAQHGKFADKARQWRQAGDHQSADHERQAQKGHGRRNGAAHQHFFVFVQVQTFARQQLWRQKGRFLVAKAHAVAAFGAPAVDQIGQQKQRSNRQRGAGQVVQQGRGHQVVAKAGGGQQGARRQNGCIACHITQALRAQHADAAIGHGREPPQDEPGAAKVGGRARFAAEHQGPQPQDGVDADLGQQRKDRTDRRRGRAIGAHQPEVQGPDRRLDQERRGQNAGSGVSSPVKPTLHPRPARAMQQQAVGCGEHDLEKHEQVEQIAGQKRAAQAHQLELEQRVKVDTDPVPACAGIQNRPQRHHAGGQDHQCRQPVEHQRDAKWRSPVARQVHAHGAGNAFLVAPLDQGDRNPQAQRAGRYIISSLVRWCFSPKVSIKAAVSMGSKTGASIRCGIRRSVKTNKDIRATPAFRWLTSLVPLVLRRPHGRCLSCRAMRAAPPETGPSWQSRSRLPSAPAPGAWGRRSAANRWARRAAK